MSDISTTSNSFSKSQTSFQSNYTLPDIHGKRDFKLSSLVSVNQLNKLAVEHIITRATNIKKNPIKYNKLAKGKLMYTLFFANSTRTRFSTETAWTKLGGTIISMSDATSTSVTKGETLDHTLRMFTGYCPDFIAIRTKEEFVAHYGCSNFEDISWINCGDGSNEHPTQAMLDIFTIQENFATHFEDNKTAELKIAFVGDIKHGRTIKSLAKVLKMFNIQMTFVAPESLHAQAEIEVEGIVYDKKDITELAQVIAKSDVIYCTRPQLERMSDEDKNIYSNGVYQITKEMMGDSKVLIMHPLPIDSSKMPEIHSELDKDARSIYFQQAANGLWTRMSIFSLLMGI